MSNDFMESIWSQFAIETEEHLEVMEQILVDAERDVVSADEISRLFRSFHSVKGLCKALDLLAMEKLAHRAEDLLGLVRDGVVRLDPPTAALLLEAVDKLKQLRELAVAQRVDGTAPENLLVLLSEAFVFAGRQGTVEEPAAIVELAAVVTSQALHEDPEMVQFFMEVVRENMPHLTGIVSPKCNLPANCSACSMCDEMRGGVETVSCAADAMGFTRIKEILDDVASNFPAGGGPVTLEQRDRIVALLPQFHELIGFVENETGHDAGGMTMATYLKASMRVNFDHLFVKLIHNLDMLEGGGADVSERAVVDEEVADSLCRKLSAANSYFAFLVPEANCNLLLLLEDVYGRAARGELNIGGEIIGLTREVLLLVQQHYLCTEEGGGDSDTQALSSSRDALGARIRDYVWAHESGGSENNPVEVFRDFVKELKINPELVEILSPENVRDLMNAVEDHCNIYEVLAHLESSEEVAGSFLTWVGRRGKVITNRSVFIDGKSWYEMLLVSKAGDAEVKAELFAIDPSETLIKLKISSSKVELPVTPAPMESKANPGAQVSSSAAANVIRVAGETLDHFMNQIGEMVMVQAQLNYAVNNEKARAALAQLKCMVNEHSIKSGQRESDNLFDICEAFEAQNRRLAEVDALILSTLQRLQVSAMALRVVPMETVFKRFPRVVRDLAQSQGKHIRLDQSGQEVKIDKAMVEVLSDPLMHMVRNSADHGIEAPEERKAAGKPEEAHILINALQQGSRVIVQVSDDGRGIDTEKVRRKAVERGLVQEADSYNLTQEEIYNFLFMPGFSTAEKITETSGRGVGMDVVRNNVMRLGGSIHIKSEFGKGSTFTLEMPLSAAVQEVLLINVAGQTLALPGRYVAEVVEVENGAVQSVKGLPAVLLRGAFLPLVNMADLLGFKRIEKSHVAHRSAVVISNGQQMVGIEVDSMVGRRELFVKDIHPRLAALPGVGGASIMGDGKVVLILDGEALFRLAESARVPNSANSTICLEAA
jgi:chemotaxis protein histidine kinase CheA